MSIKVTKTPYERCEPVGRELVKKMKEDRAYRKHSADREVGQAAKDIAHHIAGLARGRVSVIINAKDWDRIFGRKKSYA